MYRDFARLYEKLQDIDYVKFADYIEEIFKREKTAPSLVLDLACGTGRLTEILANRGYDMIGIDISPEMLSIAQEKAREKELSILYLNQDMTDFELYGTVDAIVCTLDGVNYLTEDGETDRLFELACNYLNPGGIMIFDINSKYKLEKILGNNTFVNEEDGIFYVWQNDYDEKSGICYFCLDFFEKTDDGKYKRYTEQQCERAYSAEELSFSAKSAGLSVSGIYDALSFEKARTDSERIFMVLRKI